jgi:hypothetical protein
MKSEKDTRRSFGLKVRPGAVIAAILAGAILACASVYAFAAVFDPEDSGVRLETAKVNSMAPGPAVELLGSSEALDKRTFQDTRVGGLSALTYDPVRDLYYALVDREPRSPARFYALRMPAADAALGDPEVFEVTLLRDADEDPLVAGNFDGEGIALAPWGDLYAASENEPSIRAFLREGRLLEELPVPDKFLVAPEGQARANGTFEGLALSPSGDVLFAAFQKPLLSDGNGPEQRQPVRLLRYERSGTEGFRPTAEYFYNAESGMGISEIAAVSETELLVLEGTNELFRVDLSGAGDVSGADTLAGTDLKPLEKSLLVDVDECVADAAAGGIYEGMALGPELPSGRRTLMLVTDDNFDKVQTTRVVGLGVRVQQTADGEAGGCG